QQPGVLDGDDGLRREILDQIYLLIVEGPNLLAIDSDRTNQVILLEHRHDQKRPSSGNLGNRLIGIFRSYVGDVCDLLHVSDTVEDTGRATRRNRIALAISGPSLWCIVQRYVPEYIAVVEQQVAEAGLADANSVLKHSLEHWLQLAGRAADDTEDLRGRGLLLKGFAQLVEQAGADGTDQLVIFEHRDHQHCLVAGEVHSGADKRMARDVGRYGLYVGDLDDLFRGADATQRCVRRRSQ